MRVWTVAVLLFVTLLLGEERAEACSCLPVTFEDSYAAADHVVYVRIHGVVHAGHTTRYVARLVDDDFKGCMPARSWVIVRTAADSAACGVELERGEEYLLHARTAGRLFKLPILDVQLCDANARWRDLTAEQQSFLDSNEVCCGDACACDNRDEPKRHYVATDASTCATIRYFCALGEVAFSNRCGCGCEAACAPSGCSGQVCVEAGVEAVTTCEWRPEYACYREAECARQADGSCGWTQTPELQACLASPPAPL
jgi:hypothetical protein